MHQTVISNIIIDCDDLEKGTAFWSAALGLKVIEHDEPCVFFETIGGWLDIGLQRVPEARTVKNRVHLDIRSTDIEAEVARLEGLGASRVEQVGGWWVLQDPCGNEFCVVKGSADAMPAHAKTWED